MNERRRPGADRSRRAGAVPSPHRRRAGPARRLAWVVPLLGLLAAGCRSEPDRALRAAPELRDVQATVRRFPIDTPHFVLVPADSSGIAYVPDELPVPFRIDGAPVVFSARLDASRRAADPFGVPVVLTAIRRCEPGAPPSY